MNSGRLSLLAGFAVLSITRLGHAELFFSGDFEGGGIAPWTFAIHGDRVKVIDFEGGKVGYVHLTPDDGRSRQELAHEPGARTKEGLETYYAWSFYFPEPLANCRQDIGYWEQRNVSRRTINVAVIGDQLQLETVFNTGTDFRAQYTTTVTAKAWHRIAWHVKWSQDPNVGYVEGWYDGKPAMPMTPHRTLLSDSDIFAHVGFLRNDNGAACNFAVQDMYVDNGLEASTLEGVQPSLGLPTPSDPMLPSVGGAVGAAGNGSGGGSAGSEPAPAAGSGGQSTDSFGGNAGTAALLPAAGVGGSPLASEPQAAETPAMISESDAGCAFGGKSSGAGGAAWLLAALLSARLVASRARIFGCRHASRLQRAWGSRRPG